MEGFLRYYLNFLTIGHFCETYGKTILALNFSTRKQLWELFGSSYLIYRLWDVYASDATLLDLRGNFMTCTVNEEAVEVIKIFTAWYVYSHHYQWYKEAQGLAMTAHHVITTFLLAWCFYAEHIIPGLAVLAVTSVSNPLLHLSKLLNMYGNRGRIAAFGLFATVFFLGRIVVYPKWILRHTIIDAAGWLVRPSDYAVYVMVNGGLLGLYALQWHWWCKICQILISR